MTGGGVELKANAVSKREYEAPAVKVLGTLHELTLHTKFGHHCDVTCFHHGSG